MPKISYSEFAAQMLQEAFVGLPLHAIAPPRSRAPDGPYGVVFASPANSTMLAVSITIIASVDTAIDAARLIDDAVDVLESHGASLQSSYELDLSNPQTGEVVATLNLQMRRCEARPDADTTTEGGE